MWSRGKSDEDGILGEHFYLEVMRKAIGKATIRNSGRKARAAQPGSQERRKCGESRGDRQDKRPQKVRLTMRRWVQQYRPMRKSSAGQWGMMWDKNMSVQ